MSQRALIGDTSIVLERVQDAPKARDALSPAQYLALRCLRNLCFDSMEQFVSTLRKGLFRTVVESGEETADNVSGET